MNLAVPPAWRTELRLRLRRLLALKIVGTTVFTWVFFLGYFQLLRHPATPALVMPLTPLDALVPLLPWALPAYLSLWFYIGVGPGLQRNQVELWTYGAWSAALCLVGLGCFYLWPTQVPPPDADLSGYPGFSMLQGVDAAGNACPSMHVAFAMFTAWRVRDVLRRIGAPAVLRLVNAVWFAAITLSTLVIRQHVVLDAVAGALLGGLFGAASTRWRWPANLPTVARAPHD